MTCSAADLRAGCFQKVRTQLGLAYEVGGGLAFGWDHPATFQAVVLTQSATTVDAIQQTYKVMDGLTTQPFTEEELKRAKDNILNSFLFRYDTKDKVLAERVRLEFYGYPADYLETYKAALEKVTVADLNASRRNTSIPTSTQCWWWATVRKSNRGWML